MLTHHTLNVWLHFICRAADMLILFRTSRSIKQDDIGAEGIGGLKEKVDVFWCIRL